MPPDQPTPWEIAKTEYEQALAQYQNCTALRRQDMVFVATVQGAVLTVIGAQLSDLRLAGFLLSLIAFCLLLVGLNSERRLSSYMSAYARRAREIEEQFGLSLVSLGAGETRRRRFLVSNSVAFPVFYSALMVAWVVIWVRNLMAG